MAFWVRYRLRSSVNIHAGHLTIILRILKYVHRYDFPRLKVCNVFVSRKYRFLHEHRDYWSHWNNLRCHDLDLSLAFTVLISACTALRLRQFAAKCGDKLLIPEFTGYHRPMMDSPFLCTSLFVNVCWLFLWSHRTDLQCNLNQFFARVSHWSVRDNRLTRIRFSSFCLSGSGLCMFKGNFSG